MALFAAGDARRTGLPTAAPLSGRGSGYRWEQGWRPWWASVQPASWWPAPEP